MSRSCSRFSDCTMRRRGSGSSWMTSATASPVRDLVSISERLDAAPQVGHTEGTRTAMAKAQMQSDRMMDLIREATSLQVEMLGAAARVWSEIVEHVANYNRELTNQLMRFSAGEADANAAVDKLIETGQTSVTALLDLPDEIGKTF